MGPCMNTWRRKKWRRWQRRYWSSKIWHYWVRISLGWKYISCQPMITILLLHKTCHKVKIKVERFIMWIGAIMEFPAASGGCKELKSVCSISPRHLANAGKYVCYADVIYGVIDGQHFHIHGINEINYTMMLMKKYGTLERSFNERKRCINGETLPLKYLDIFWNQYTYRHDFENHNNCRKSPIIIENTWAISYWPNRVFAFLLGVT